MAWLFWAVAHDLWQSLPNTFHRTAGNLYDWVAWQNGVLTGGWLKNTFKTATSIFWAINFVPTIAGLGIAWLANGVYNKASGKWWFFEWLAAPTKWAANWAKEWITWTMWNTWKLVSWTGKAIAGTLTAPLDIAFWRTRTSTWLQPDYNKSATYSNYATIQAPNSSNNPSNPEQPNKQDTPIPTPTPNPSTPPSNSEQPKTPKEKKKEEENQKKEEEKKLSDDAKKKSENYGKSIDKITPKLNDTKNFIDTNRKSDEKEELLNEIEERINKFWVITNDYSVIYRNATSKKLLNNTKATDKPEDFYNSVIEIKDFLENKMLSDDGWFDKYDDLIIDKKNSISIKSFIRHIDNLANNIESDFYDSSTSTWKDGSITPLSIDENKSLIWYQKEFGNIFMITWKWLENKEKDFNKEVKKINDIKPSDLKKQEDKIIDHISKLSSLLETSKWKIAAEKWNFWSGKITSINTEYIKEISEEITELQNELWWLSSWWEKSIHRKDIEKQLSPLFWKINEAFNGLNT